MNTKHPDPNKRLEWLDIAKGLAIILVVTGHLIQNRIENYDLNPIFKIIYMFHMPLFFYISGIAYQLSISNNNTKTLLTTSQRLLLPLFIWYLVTYVNILISSSETISITQHFKKLYQTPDNGLWFLWVLFAYHLLAKICSFNQINYKINPLISYVVMIGFLVLISTKYDALGIKLIIKHLPYFLAGLTYQKTINLFNKNSKKILLATLICFSLIYSVWARNLNDISSNIQALLGVPVMYDILFLPISLGLTFNAGFLGIIIFINLSFVLNGASINFLKSIMSMIGQRTLEIYVAHFYFLNLSLLPNQLWIDIPIIVFTIIGISIILSIIVKTQMPLAAFFLYGHKVTKG